MSSSLSLSLSPGGDGAGGRPALLRRGRGRPQRVGGALMLGLRLGDSENTGRGRCLDIPRFEESLNNKNKHNNTFQEQGI